MKKSNFLETYAKRAAEIFLSTGVINFSVDKPFILTSGKASPVYVDCRRLISFPDERRELMQMAKNLLLKQFGDNQTSNSSDVSKLNFDKVAGGETAGIPYAAWLADLTHLPMLYVRKQAKGFGRHAQIEGVLEEGDHVLLVEDLATDGGSKEIFIQALRKAGAIVNRIFVLFYYDIFPHGEELMSKLGVEMNYLVTWKDIITVARNYFKDDKKLQELKIIEDFLNSSK